MAEATVKISEIKTKKSKTTKNQLINRLRESKSDEVVFAVVGYAGSGTSFLISQLSASLSAMSASPFYQTLYF